MTSLSKQLAVLRSTRTNELDLKAQKAIYSKSLLFEPAIAANQSLDSLFQICFEGFQELCALDSKFLRYQRSIFSPHSKSQDRNTMTVQENKHLDEVAESFLALVGARLQLKPAVKAIEWLVRRFRINELNVESFVLTFLPYHNLPIFTTMLLILPTSLPPSLKFLNRYVSALENPPRSVFVQATVQYPAFFNILNQYILKASRAKAEHRALISAWTSVMVQSVDTILSTSVSARSGLQQQREEELYTRLFPVLNETLSSNAVPELVIGSYMVILVLVGKGTLGDQVLDTFMKAICKSWTHETAAAGLACLGQIAEQRQHMLLPKSAVSALLKLDDLQTSLVTLARQQSIDRLVIGLIETLAKSTRSGQQSSSLELTRLAFEQRLLTKEVESSFSQRLAQRLAKAKPQAQMTAGQATYTKSLVALLQLHASASQVRSEQKYEELAVDRLESDGDNAATDVANAEESEKIDVDVELGDVRLRDNQTSFLTDLKTTHFDLLLPLFESLASSSSQVSSFMKSRIFSPAKVRKYRFYSFMMRAVCTSKSISARSKALSCCAADLREHGMDEGLRMFLAPYTLSALTDESKQVRSAATQLLKTLEVVPAESTKTRSSEARDILADYEGLERSGSSDSHSGATTQDYETFIRALNSQGIDECIADRTRIVYLLRNTLGSSQQSPEMTTNTKQNRLRSAQRSRLYKHMCDQATSTHARAARLQLLEVLNKVDKINGKPRSQYLLPLLRHRISRYASETAAAEEEAISLSRYDKAMLALVHHADLEALQLLLDVILGDQSDIPEQFRLAAFARIQGLWRHAHSNTQGTLAISAMHVAMPASTQVASPAKQSQAEALLRSLSIPASTLKHFVDEAIEEIGKMVGSSTKRRRTSNGQTAPAEWNQVPVSLIPKLTLILELVDANPSQMTVELFHSVYQTLPLIGKISGHVDSEMSYITTLALSILCSAMQMFEREKLSPRVDTAIARADVLVDYIQTTSSAQARNSALLLLAMLVKLAPQTVLQSVMPVFTMMSSTTARQSDDFSAHVVNETIQAIVPALSRKLQEQRKDLVTSMAEIIVSFAAAFEHIPPHRRLQLFSLLASSLDSEQSLYAIIATLVDQCQHTSELDSFISTLFMQFGTPVAMLTIQKYAELVADGLRDKPKLYYMLIKPESSSEDKTASLGSHLRIMALLLETTPFRSNVRRDLKDDELSVTLRQSFTTSLQQLIGISQLVMPSLRASTQAAIEGVLGMFPFDAMITNIEPLFSHPDQSLARTSLKVVEQRVRRMKQAASGSRRAMMSLLPRLTTIISKPMAAVLKPAALACIDCICEKFGKSDLDVTLATMQVVAGPGCLGASDPSLKTLSLQCLATAVEVLGNDFIPLWDITTKGAIESLGQAVDAATRNEQLHNAAYAFYSALSDSLAYMMSQPILSSVLISMQASVTASFSAAADASRAQFLQLCSLKVDVSTIVRAVNHVWIACIGSGPGVCLDLVRLVQSTLEAQAKSTITRASRDFSALFLQLLDLRSVADKSQISYSQSALDPIEEAINHAFVAYVLKINDAVFRPFFAQLIDWSTSSQLQQSSGGHSVRRTALFKISYSLSERLKSIFTSYFNSLVEPAAEILQNPATSGPTERSLKIAVVNAITSAFRHDQDDFWQAPSRFDLITGPLISQLASSNRDYLDTYVVPCITELGSATAASSENLKSLNSLILKQFRAESPKARLAAVKVQQSLAKRLGDEWLANLPEMLPYINELQEDDDEKVEKQTHKWIKDIEEILGESLSSMLQ